MVIKGSTALACIFLLTGCPGQGDRFRPDETTQVKSINGNICFAIANANAQDYQPVLIAINPRGTPPQQQAFIDNPQLSIKSSHLCLPPLFYPFADNEKYIVELVLISPGNTEEPRKLIVGVGVNNDRVYNFPLTDREITRPYGAIQVAEE